MIPHEKIMTKYSIINLGPDDWDIKFREIVLSAMLSKDQKPEFQEGLFSLVARDGPPQDSKIQPSVSTSSGRMDPEVREDVLGQEDY